MTVWIYGLRHPTTRVIRYVGKTEKGLNVRLKKHIEDAASSRYRHLRKSKWIAFLARNGLVPDIFVLQELSPEEDWRLAERRWIARFREDGLDLLNLTDGGDGVSGYVFTPELIEKSVAARRGRPSKLKGKKATPEARAKMSASHKSRVRTPQEMERVHAAMEIGRRMPRTAEHRSKIGAANSIRRKGSKLSTETRAKVSAARTGVPKSAETRARMSQAQKGRTVSAEHRAKLSMSVRRYFAHRKQQSEQMELFADGGPVRR